MSASDIYDLEGVLENAAKVALNALGLTCFTTQDGPEFQKVRPRVEIKATINAGRNRFVTLKNGAVIDHTTVITPSEAFLLRRESAWSFRLEFAALTKADIAAHTAYRAEVRAALAQLAPNINTSAAVTRHVIQMGTDNGASPVMVAPEQGLMKTELSFDGTISINQGAWSALTT